jgi:hypothetical protein
MSRIKKYGELTSHPWQYFVEITTVAQGSNKQDRVFE